MTDWGGIKEFILQYAATLSKEKQRQDDLQVDKLLPDFIKSDNSEKSMRFIACYLTVAVFGIVLGCGRYVEGAPADTSQQENALTSFIRYSRGLDKELQLARYLLTHQRILNSNNKRNSELINSLLGLPKNINNIGK